MEKNDNYTVKQGSYGNLTKEQEQVLRDFIYEIKNKGLFCPERHNIHTLLRFLRARDFDLKKTLAMFTECEKWRKEENVDDIYKNFKYTEEEEVSKIYPKFYHNVDLQGRPIYVEQFSKLDVKKLFKITTEERLLKNFILDYEITINERFPYCSNAAGHHVETGFTIMDLKNVGIRQFSKCFEFIKMTSKIASNYYPEIMGNLFVVNAPSVFSMCWKLIKGILDPVTVNKIHILNSHYEKELLKYAAPESLPKEYGGTCECAEGCQHSNIGPWNDPQYTHPEDIISVDEWLKSIGESIGDGSESETTMSESFEKMNELKKASSNDKHGHPVKSALPSPPLSPNTFCSECVSE